MYCKAFACFGGLLTLMMFVYMYVCSYVLYVVETEMKLLKIVTRTMWKLRDPDIYKNDPTRYSANGKDVNASANATANLTVLKSCHCVICRVVVRALVRLFGCHCVKILQLQRVEVAPRRNCVKLWLHFCDWHSIAVRPSPLSWQCLRKELRHSNVKCCHIHV